MIKFQSTAIRVAQLFLMGLLLFSLGACGRLAQFNIDVVQDNTEYQQSSSVASLALPPGLSKPDFNPAYQVPGVSPNSAAAGTRSRAVALSAPSLSTNPVSAASTPDSLNGRLVRLDSGQTVLLFSEPYRRLWPLVGSRLGAAGMSVLNQQEARGIYTVRYASSAAANEEEVLPLQRLANSLLNNKPASVEKNYLILVAENAQGSFVGVSDEQGKSLNENVTREILQRLQGQLARRSRSDFGVVAVTTSVSNQIDSRIVKLLDGQAALSLKAPYGQIWPATAKHLQALGATIVKQQPEQGRYTIRYRVSDSDEDVLPLQRLVNRYFNQSPERQAAETYLILVKESEQNSLIGISDGEGVPVENEVAETILKRLQAQFNG